MKTLRSIRVLFYADMEAIVPHCVAAAEMLRSQLGAHIIMTVLDRRTHFDKAFKNFEVYDHNSLFQLSNRFVPVESTDADSSSAISDGAVNRSIDAKAPHRISLFGLRKSLSRNRALKDFYTQLRRLPSRIPMVRLIAQSLRILCTRRFLRTIQPDIIILAEDNVGRLSTTFVNEGRKQRIPSIIIPFTIPNPLEPAKAYRNQRRNQVRGPLAWLVSSLYPKWRFQLDGQDLLRLPASSA